MNRGILGVLAIAISLASCSTAYRQGQTPDDVYYSPRKEKQQTYAAANNNRQYDRYNRNQRGSDYDDYTSSSEDDYLRMKIQNRYRWGALDDYDYWYSPNYAFNNYYGYNSFNPLMFNSWGLSYYYSPFASIQPYGWFNNFYPSYGYYSPYSGYFGHSYGYGYSPVFLNTATTTRNNVHRPMLGGYANNNYSNSNNRNTGRYVPAFNGTDSRYNNRNYNNNNSFNNNNGFNRSNNNSNFGNSNNNSAPVRSFTPSSNSGGSSGGGGGVTRQPHH